MWAICDTFGILTEKQRDEPLNGYNLGDGDLGSFKSIFNTRNWNPAANKCIVRYLHHWIYWGIEMTLHYRFTSMLSLFLYKTLVLIFFHPLYLLSSPFLSHFLFCCLCDWLPFPSPLDVISKTRSPWQQLVTSSSPTLVFDGCFYFGGFVNAPIPHWQIAK